MEIWARYAFEGWRKGEEMLFLTGFERFSTAGTLVLVFG